MPTPNVPDTPWNPMDAKPVAEDTELCGQKTNKVLLSDVVYEINIVNPVSGRWEKVNLCPPKR